MPILAILSLAVSLTKVLIQVMEYLHDHPEIGAGLRGQVAAINLHLQGAQTLMASHLAHDSVESP